MGSELLIICDVLTQRGWPPQLVCAIIVGCFCKKEKKGHNVALGRYHVRYSETLYVIVQHGIIFFNNVQGLISFFALRSYLFYFWYHSSTLTEVFWCSCRHVNSYFALSSTGPLTHHFLCASFVGFPARLCGICFFSFSLRSTFF